MKLKNKLIALLRFSSILEDMKLKNKLIALLRYSQKYTKTDMVYAAQGGFWILAGRTGILFLSLISMAAFANWLPAEEYGVYQFVLSGAILAGLFALPGIDTALVKSIVRAKEGTLRLAIKEKFKWSLLGSLSLLLLAGWYLFQENHLLATAFLIAATFVPSQRIFLLFIEFWNGRKRFDIQSKYTVYSAALSLLILIPVLYATNDVLWVLFAYFLSHAVFEGLFLLKTLRQVKNREEDKDVIPFGKSLTAMNSLETVTNNIDKMIIWHFLGPVQVAIYSFARMPIKSLGGVLPLRALVLPRLGEKNIRDIKKGLTDKFYRLFVVSIPTAIILVLVAPFAYTTIFPQYMDSVVYFQALTILLAIIPFGLLEFALVSDLRKKELYVIRVVTPLVRIILFLALIPFFGIWGIVSALIAASLLRGLLTLYYFQKI